MPSDVNSRLPAARSSNRGRPVSIATAIVVGALLSGCSMPKLPKMPELPNIPGVYRLDIQQGNVLTAESVAKLELGMSKRKVRFVLGTPAVNDIFHESRWDYVYSFAPGGERTELKRLSLVFDEDVLAKIEGADGIIGDAPVVAEAQNVVVDVPKGRSDGSILGRFTRPFRDRRRGEDEDRASLALTPDDPRIGATVGDGR
ncbi:MAG: outer membrane protein assembly factor BamE [Gammaproteobacteria bacterium]|nr:outer membrane protein assembly factor BamE [Gammaproteobacteria bacterium]